MGNAQTGPYTSSLLYTSQNQFWHKLSKGSRYTGHTFYVSKYKQYLYKNCHFSFLVVFSCMMERKLHPSCIQQQTQSLSKLVDSRKHFSLPNTSTLHKENKYGLSGSKSRLECGWKRGGDLNWFGKSKSTRCMYKHKLRESLPVLAPSYARERTKKMSVFQVSLLHGE